MKVQAFLFQVILFSAFVVPVHATTVLPLAPKASDGAAPQEPRGPMEPGLNTFVFSGWKGPELKVYAYLPGGVDLKRAPILIMMHGMSRNPDRYIKSWAPLAEKHGFVVVGPEFSEEDFPGGWSYNLGNIWDRSKKQFRDESLWSFSAIEPLFDHVVEEIGSEQTRYSIYGHSAGSQFVHRYLYFKPDARVSRYFAANAGWYTLPDLNEAYPYGLEGTPIDWKHLRAVYSKEVVVLLGEEDNDPDHPTLRRTPEAMRQGDHRLARGRHYFAYAKRSAEVSDFEFNWRLVTVPGVGHSNAGMAEAVAGLVEGAAGAGDEAE